VALRTVGVKLQAEVAGYVAGMRQAGMATRNLVGEMDRAARAGQLDEVAQQAAGVGIGLLAAGGMAVKFGMDFDKQMSAVQAATKATSGDLEKMREAALQAGQTTKYSATEAAQGIEELAKAGISTSAILSGGLAGALDLAAAGGLEVAEAAETAASAMTQFKLRGSDVPHIADLLAAAAGKAQGSVHDMGQALNQAGLVSAQMGLSIEDTVGTLASFASAGLLGSDAGTSLKTAMLMLANPTKESKELMAELGLSVYDAQGQFIGITALAGQLKTQLGGLTQEQRNAALAQIFGSDAIRAASILYEQGAEGIGQWIGKVNDQGYAAETAATKTNNLAGDLERLKGSLETLAIESSTGATSGLRTVVQAADRLVASVSAIPAPIQNAGIILAGVGGAALLAAAGAARLRGATSGALEQLSQVGPTGERAARGLERAQQVAGRVAISLAAINAASALMGDSLHAQTSALSAGLKRFSDSGAVAGEAARVFGEDLGGLDTALKDVADTGRWSSFARGTAGVIEGFTGLGQVADDSLTKSRERLTALDQALAQMVQSGQGAQAAEVFKTIADRAREQGVSVDELKKVLPGYAGALESANSAAMNAATSGGAAAGGIDQVGMSAEEAESQVAELKEAFDELFEATMSADEAALKSAESIEDLDKTFEKHKATIDLDTEAGKANRRAVLDRIDSIKDERDARIANGMTLDEANKKYQADIDGLRKSMRQAGFTKKQIDELTAAYRQIPDEVETVVSVTGDKKAGDRLGDLYVQQRALKQGTTVAEERRRYEKLNSFADGGQVSGWSPHRRADNIPAMLTADEWVHPVASVDYYGAQVMDAIQHRRIPAEDLQALTLADGGRVRWPFPVTAAGTRIPSWREVASMVTPGIPTSGATAPAMIAAIRQAFPGLGLISGFRRGSRTLSGNLSYHALNRAVDYPPSRELAAWMYRNYKPKLKEAITPYPEYNVLRGQDHVYTGAVWRQHNFAGGNAHDHFAMASGGVIKEPVFGWGLSSGASYSFGERGPETVVPGVDAAAGSGGTVVVNRTINVTVNVPPGANLAEVGRLNVEAIRAYEQKSGTSWRMP
jgi:TP901 family phage tail tape measure protein